MFILMCLTSTPPSLTTEHLLHCCSRTLFPSAANAAALQATTLGHDSCRHSLHRRACHRTSSANARAPTHKPFLPPNHHAIVIYAEVPYSVARTTTTAFDSPPYTASCAQVIPHHPLCLELPMRVATSRRRKTQQLTCVTVSLCYASNPNWV